MEEGIILYNLKFEKKSWWNSQEIWLENEKNQSVAANAVYVHMASIEFNRENFM